ncbi:hypothetical protein CDL15_Pgr022227 [Punica granatum]|uniref:ZF-HD dimerization-type domain-containing protein n=1 Tax=Punica granatum TaxID=22663 RepID=A0A218WMS8_PUNGR|nr:hypothetical protein CDL15_Pgr022227 [Punica granatum]PKI45052.1 hypothetical protein CRG98_034553 [Punica granatum]
MKKVVLVRREATDSSSSPSSSSAATNVRYAECQRNYAASTGGHIVDGCRAFVASSSGANSFACASCGCHRNFHRKVVEQ